jgi:hypothetical protein
MAMNKIAFLNDGVRRTFSRGKVVMTAAVAALPEERREQVLRRVQTFDQFTEDNDPMGEHDFGSFELGGEQFFFKLDYYNKDMLAGSEDPADPEQTTRVLTIGFMSDY